jgi:hypothetical protein
MKSKSNGLSAAQFFREYFGESPLYDSVEVVRAVEKQCARCGQQDGQHEDGCVENGERHE